MEVASLTIGKKLEICFEAGAGLTLIIVGICVILNYVYPESTYPVCGLTFLFLGLFWTSWKYLPVEKKMARGIVSIIIAVLIPFCVHLWVLSATNPAEYNRMMNTIYLSMAMGFVVVVISWVLDKRGVFESFKKDIRRILK